MAHERMTHIEYRNAYERIGLVQEDIVDLFTQGIRTVKRHANKEARIPATDAILLRLLLHGVISIHDVKRASQNQFGAGAGSPAASSRARGRS